MSTLNTQQPYDQGFGTSQTCTLTGVQAGDSLVLCLRERDQSAEPTVSDSINGSWGASVVTRNATANRVSIFRFHNSGAGNPIITVSYGASSRVFQGVGAAITPAPGASITDGLTSGAGTSPAGTGHSAGNVVAGAGFVIAASGHGGDSGGETIGDGMTAFTMTAGEREYHRYKLTSGETLDSDYTTVNSIDADHVIAAFTEVTSGDVEQAAARWRADDGDEDGATWLAAQDASITREDDTPTRLRLRLQAVDDPSGAAYGLQVRRNGGSWVDVGPAPTAPSVAWGAAGTAANGTTSATPSYPTGITAGTSWLYCQVWSGASGEPTPTMPAGWTQLGTRSGGSGATFGADVGNRRATLFRKDAVAGTETGTVTVSLTSGNTMRAVIFRVEVPSGFTISEQWQSGEDTSHGTGWSAAMGASQVFSVDDLVLVATAQSTDNATQSSQSLTASGVTFGTRTNRESTAVTTGNDLRAVLESIPVTAGATATATWAHTNSANASGATAVVVLTALPPTPAVVLAPSANIAGSAATSTTEQLSGGTGAFTAGRISDDTNPLPSINLDDDGFTEVEWCVTAPASGVDDTDVLEFRAVRGGSPLDTYTVVPEWTIGTPSGGGPVEVVTTLASDAGAAPAALSQMLGAAALAAGVASGPAGQGTLQGASSLALSVALTPQGLAQLQAAVAALVAAASEAAAAATVAAGGLTFGANAQTAETAAAQTAGSAPLAASSAVTAASVAQALVVLPFAINGQLSPQGVALLAAALGLTASAADGASAPAAATDVTVTLPALGGVTQTGSVTAQGPLGLGVVGGLAPQPLAQALGLLALASAGAATPDGRVLASALLALATHAQMAAIAADPSTVATVALMAQSAAAVSALQLASAVQAYIAQAGLTMAAQSTQGAALAMALLANLEATVQRIALGTAHLAAAGLATPTSQQLARGPVVLTATAAAPLDARQQALTSLVLSVAALFDLVATSSGDPTINLLAIVAEQLRVARVTGEGLTMPRVDGETLTH